MSVAREFAKGVPAAAGRRPLPPFAEEHQDLRASIRRFVEKELRPHAAEWDDERWFPNAVFTKLAANGFLGLKYPERYGGHELDVSDGRLSGDPARDAHLHEHRLHLAARERAERDDDAAP